MNTYLSSFFIVALEVLCCKIFFETFEKKTVRKSKEKLLLVVLFIVDNMISFLMIDNIILKQVVTTKEFEKERHGVGFKNEYLV